MASCARREIIRPGAAGIFHCWQRCVRRAYLLGKDPLTGKDHTHRREWFIQRLRLLVSCFAIDVAFEAILSNHFHLVLRTDVPCTSGQRASDKGLLSMTVDEYLNMLDWSGRQLRANKRGAIPADLAPILERLGIDGEELLDTLEEFPRLFRRLVGRSEQIIERAHEVGRRWLHGVRPAARVFRP